MSVNKHINHLEEAIIKDNWFGVNQVDFILNDYLKYFARKKLIPTFNYNQPKVSIKYDGAPAIIIGKDPETGLFFVATKSLFNVKPKINYSHVDINNNHNGELADILHVVFTEFENTWNSNLILQGGLLFTKNILKHEIISDENCLTFQPNTLKYCVLTNSTIGKEILTAKLGIAFHTTYTGPDLRSLTANFGVNLNNVILNKEIFITQSDYFIHNHIKFTPEEELQFTNLMFSSRMLVIKLMRPDFISEILSNDVGKLLIQHHNYKIKKGQTIDDVDDMLQDFYCWLQDKHSQNLRKLKTEKGKYNRINKHNELIYKIKKHELSIKKLLEYQKIIIQLKHMLLEKLEELKLFDIYVEDSGNYIRCSNEGYVIPNKDKTAALKLVDRLKFSLYNFNRFNNN